MTIGQVAKAAGVHVETIRFYQRMKLLTEPQRPLGSVRRYPAETVSRLAFIRRAQQLGFSLEEIGSLLALEEARSCRKTHDLALRKLEIVEARVADLNRLRRTLKKLIAQCEGGQGSIACPIISTLSAAGAPVARGASPAARKGARSRTMTEMP